MGTRGKSTVVCYAISYSKYSMTPVNLCSLSDIFVVLLLSGALGGNRSSNILFAIVTIIITINIIMTIITIIIVHYQYRH